MADCFLTIVFTRDQQHITASEDECSLFSILCHVSPGLLGKRGPTCEMHLFYQDVTAAGEQHGHPVLLLGYLTVRGWTKQSM